MGIPAKKTSDSAYLDFLEPKAASLLGEDNATRVDFIKRDYWLDYPAASEILDDFQDVLDSPKVVRPPCRLLIGPHFNGKTSVLKEFHKRNPVRERDDLQGIVAPVIAIQAPSHPDEMSFYSSILNAICAPTGKSDRISRRIDQTIKLLDRVNCKVIVIDEIHNMLSGGTSKQRMFANTLRYLTNEAGISLICAGIKSALNVFTNDAQLATRSENRYLPRWNNDADYRTLIATLEANLPLRKYSGISENRDMRAALFNFSGGLFGHTKKAVSAAAIAAIRQKNEQITIDILSSIKLTPDGELPEVPHGLE